MLTLAAIFLIYIIVESLKGSGAIAALLFGLVLGNKKTFHKILKMKERSRDAHESVKATQTEVSFFIRSFFFVYLGLIATINMQFILYGAAVVVILVVVRLLAVEISTIKMGLRENEKNIIRIMTPRGLAVAVMAQVPLSLGLPYGNEILNIGFIVILGTTLYTTIMVFIFRKHLNKKTKRLQKVSKKSRIQHKTFKNKKTESTPVENKQYIGRIEKQESQSLPSVERALPPYKHKPKKQES